ncbi:MAG: hypothetical protein LH614_06870 [Pyrinomonadaceae bacterium]|nr:hypothetical protein [Pyrinomonadaceae bacterium]
MQTKRGLFPVKMPNQQNLWQAREFIVRKAYTGGTFSAIQMAAFDGSEIYPRCNYFEEWT